MSAVSETLQSSGEERNNNKMVLSVNETEDCGNDLCDFEKFCSDLGIVEDVWKKAHTTWQEIVNKRIDDFKDVPKTEWFTCVVYIVTVDMRMPYGPTDPQLLSGHIGIPITITELLKRSSMNIRTLFQRMSSLRQHLSLSESVRYHLITLEKKYCIVSALFHAFERLCQAVFREDLKEQVQDELAQLPVSQTETTDYRKKLCWSLFLHVKGALLAESQELVYAFYMLLCCVEFVLRITPSFQLHLPFDIIRIGSTENTDPQDVNLVMLQKLAEEFQTGFEEVRSVQQFCTEPFIQKLKDTDGDLDLPKLTRLYKEAYRKEGDLDEMLFLQHDPHLLPAHTNGATTSPTEPPITPVRAALNTIQQLKKILSTAQDEPGSSLKEYFENCSMNPSASISSRVQELRSNFKKNFIAVCGSNQEDSGEQRFQLAVRFYYRAMEALLNFEKERLSQTDFSNLLNNDTFHRSLWACSAEIVLVTYGVSWIPATGTMGSQDSQLAFPWILEVCNLHPYDFYKVLESFIKVEPTLTREIIKHLQEVETRILDHLAWKEGSPLFDAITKSQISKITVPTSQPMELSNDDFSSAELYLSPMRCVRGRGASPKMNSSPSPRKSQTHSPSSDVGDQASPTQSKTVLKKSESLTMFLNKVCRLSYHRLQALCGLLEVPRDLQHKIWTCFEYCITLKPELMKNRHLDQIMMCSIYAICKVVEKEIKFKTIVHMYRNLPHADPQVFKNALIDGNQYDSIIGFYNRIFMQNMKCYILQFASAKPSTPTLSPVPKPVASSLTASPQYSIPGRKNFYVSPLKESPFKLPPSPSQLTPTSRKLYSFGEGLGSAEKLRNINESLSAFRSKNSHASVPKRQKRLNFDQPEEESQNSSSQCQDACPIVVKKQKMSQLPSVITPAQENSTSNKPENQSRENMTSSVQR